MRILLTGATGYIGKRLLPALINNGHHVVCCVRDKERFNPPQSLQKNLSVLEIDFLDEKSVNRIPRDINAAYYLIHSMSGSKNYSHLELLSALNFRHSLENSGIDQVIYLSGIVNEKNLSKHLASRKAVEKELEKGNFNLTTLRAGIIIGAGSSSFEIIRDLVEKLPVMIAPKWLNTRCQPIGISDVLKLLLNSLMNTKTYNQNFDIGGKDILTYKEMLLGFAGVRKLKRWIITVPVMTPKLSSYWLYFITSTSFKLATALVSSMKIEVICRDNRINQILDVRPEGYLDALKRTFSEIEDNMVISSWKDSLISGRLDLRISEFLNVPSHGCMRDIRKIRFHDRDKLIKKIWRIGGNTGWYYANFLWKIRGMVDKFFGGVGLRRGRTHPEKISPGDAIDFWRVLFSDKKEGRLLLFAEMKLPGEAWLEFKINSDEYIQTATFRPRGLTGRAYWYLLLPFHKIIFRKMAQRISE